MAKNKHDRQTILRAIPPVDDVLADGRLAELHARHPGFPWTALVRTILDEFRSLADPALALSSVDRDGIRAWVVDRVCADASELQCGGLRRVLNGTGVVLHTNLGRAAWGPGAIEAARVAMSGYVSLEIDLDSGERSKRGELLERLICLATGAESAIVVNNNAAAVYLCVNSFSPPGRVVVSRGELVEIGGSFRLPEILGHAASEVIEVGTTNRTYADDYKRVVREGDVILKVHKSNYAIEGFAHEATVGELCDVANDAGAHMIYDLGSGSLFDLAGSGLGSDPTVIEVVARGVGAVTMSTDKLLGGPQAGVVAGSALVVSRLKQNPLRRALRVDKVTIAALQELLRAYLFSFDPRAEIPALGQMLASPSAGRLRAEALAVFLAPGLASAGDMQIVVCDDEAAVGGGSLAAQAIASAAVAIQCGNETAARRLLRRLRLGDPPVFARIRGNEVRINMTTILPGEEELLQTAVAAALSE